MGVCGGSLRSCATTRRNQQLGPDPPKGVFDASAVAAELTPCSAPGGGGATLSSFMHSAETPSAGALLVCSGADDASPFVFHQSHSRRAGTHATPTRYRPISSKITRSTSIVASNTRSHNGCETNQALRRRYRLSGDANAWRRRWRALRTSLVTCLHAWKRIVAYLRPNSALARKLNSKIVVSRRKPAI